MRKLITIIIYIFTIPILAYGILLLALTLLAAPLGGPREAPSNMSREEFKEYKESGRWFRESISLGAGCIILPVISIVSIIFITKKKN